MLAAINSVRGSTVYWNWLPSRPWLWKIPCRAACPEATDSVGGFLLVFDFSSVAGQPLFCIFSLLSRSTGELTLLDQVWLPTSSLIHTTLRLRERRAGPAQLWHLTWLTWLVRVSLARPRWEDSHKTKPTADQGQLSGLLSITLTCRTLQHKTIFTIVSDVFFYFYQLYYFYFCAGRRHGNPGHCNIIQLSAPTQCRLQNC